MKYESSYYKSKSDSLLTPTHVTLFEDWEHIEVENELSVQTLHRTCAETAAVSRGTSHVTTKQSCKICHFGGY